MEQNAQYHVKHADTGKKPVQRTQQGRQPYYNNTIDLYRLWQAILKRIWTVLCAVLVGACIAADITVLFITPKYTSSSLVLVQARETSQTSQDVQFDTSLMNDYEVLIKSRPVLNSVIQNLHLNMGYQTLQGMITITQQSTSRVLQLSVESTDPQQAKEIVDELSNVSADYIGSKMDVNPPQVVEYGEVPTRPTSPDTRRNIAIGALIGLLVILAVIIAGEMMDDTLSTEDDVEHYMGLVTLAVVPDKGDGTKKSAGKRRWKFKLHS